MEDATDTEGNHEGNHMLCRTGDDRTAGTHGLPTRWRRRRLSCIRTSGNHRDGHVHGNPERRARREFGRHPGRDGPSGAVSAPIRERCSGGSRRRGEHVRRFHGLRRHRPDHHGIARRRQRAGARHRERHLRIFRHFRVAHCRPQRSGVGRVEDRQRRHFGRSRYGDCERGRCGRLPDDGLLDAHRRGFVRVQLHRC